MRAVPLSAERLTKLAAKTASIGNVGRGWGGITQADIAYACSGTKGTIYELLMFKYVWWNGENAKKKRQQIENKVLEVVPDPANVEQAISAFLHNGICPKCNGYGTYATKCRHIKPCSSCDQSGTVAFVITGFAKELHALLADAELVALTRAQRRLR